MKSMCVGAKLDAHLLRNGLERVSAKYYLATNVECDELFAMSDYLSLGLSMQGQASVPYTQEAELLAHYAAFLKACKYPNLMLSVAILPSTNRSTMPHLACDSVRLLLQQLGTSSAGPATIGVVFSDDGIVISVKSPPASASVSDALRKACTAINSELLHGQPFFALIREEREVCLLERSISTQEP